MKILNLALCIEGIFLGAQRCIQVTMENVSYEPSECNSYAPEFILERDDEDKDDRNPKTDDDDEEKIVE
jgi:hypothetical protein